MRISQKVTKFIRENLGDCVIEIDGNLVEFPGDKVSISFPKFYYMEDEEFKKKFMEE